MSKKRYRPEEIIGKLREADVLISQGKKVSRLSRPSTSPTSPIIAGGRSTGDVRTPGQAPQGAGEGERAAPEGSIGPDPGQDDSEGGGKGKLLSPSRRRACVKALCEGLTVSERRVCKVLGQYRSTQRHVAAVKSDKDALTSVIVQLASQHGRYGYRRVTGLLREAGWKVNKKRVERIWRREGLKVPARQPLGEWIHRVIQREVAGRAAEPGAFLHAEGGPCPDRAVAATLQRSKTAGCVGIPTTGT